MLSTSAFIALAMQCAASVHPDTSHEIARVESGFNPYAIAEIISKDKRKPGDSGVVSTPVAGGMMTIHGYAGIAVFNPYRSFILRCKE